jgi:N utilization substance protein A
MNGNEILRLVDALHRDKNIDQEVVFDGIEQAIMSAARKHFGDEAEIDVHINREDGEVSAMVEGDALNSNEIGELLGRIAAQTAKQVMIQKIREAERDSLYEEFSALKSQIMTGTVSRVDGGSCTVNLGKVDGILPRSEQIPGEGYRTGERVRAVIMNVRKQGSRVKIILSRRHPDLVRRLFELEIPEVAERVIEVRSLAREAGYRSKVAVTCYDSKIDCVGACVGVRGARIRSVVDELAGERIDIVRWNDSLQVLVPNALQPAEVEDVILCPMLGKVIVLVRDDQLSLAIGKKGQNVRLASKLVGWDIHVMTQERLDGQLDVSVSAFTEVPGITSELAEGLVSQGFFTFDDLSVIEPDQLAELGGLTPEECDTIVAYADVESERIEKEEIKARAEARRARELDAAIAEAGGTQEQQIEAEQQTETAVVDADAGDADAGDADAGDADAGDADAGDAEEDSAGELPDADETESVEINSKTADTDAESEVAESEAISQADTNAVDADTDAVDDQSEPADAEPEPAAAEAAEVSKTDSAETADDRDSSSESESPTDDAPADAELSGMASSADTSIPAGDSEDKDTENTVRSADSNETPVSTADASVPDE